MSLLEKKDYMEKLLVEHCAPTLASLKTGNIFTLSYDSNTQLNELISLWNEYLSPKGVTVTVLRLTPSKAMLYVYRKNKLKKDLSRAGVDTFLKDCGYKNTNHDYAVEYLKKRLQKSADFPHEIGLFLSYPLDDVTAFIKNGGKNCKLTGYWKVYCNEAEAEKMFAKFNKCKAIYCKLWQQGRSILQLTVA